MSIRNERAVIATPDAMADLQNLVSELNRAEENGLAPLALELRKIVSAWMDSGPNLVEFHFANLPLWHEAMKAFRPSLVPTKSGCARILFTANAGPPGALTSLGKAGVRFYALCLFNSLIVNPLWQKLAGPCPRCNRYYIKKRKSQKVYCSRRCGNTSTAIARTGKQRQDARKDDLKSARKAIRKLKPTREGWKEVVSKETGLTVKWLTRAEHYFGLKPPRKEGRHAKS